MIRSVRTLDYNWDFDTSTGYFQRWGRTQEHDPLFSPLGPEILDLEISTICRGPDGKPCSFCYKSNTGQGKHMPLEKFKTILHRMPSNLTQIAFGIGDTFGHPQLEQILQETRSTGIIPNITINGGNNSDSSSDYSILADNCGSVAVSCYEFEQCFDCVHGLTSKGMKQVNIHQLVSADTAQKCLDLIDAIKEDKRLENLHAVVFLMLKPKGRAKNLSQIDPLLFREIISKAYAEGITFGFDSCSAPMVMKALETQPNFEKIREYIEPCESFLFSSYCNVDGEFFPCSFCEGEEGWETGLAITEETDFINDIWNHRRMIEWREKLLSSTDNCVCANKIHCRACPVHKNITKCM